MKKIIIASIFLFNIFAIQNIFADCYFNYPYNWQYVTYCYGDNYNSGDNNYYNYNNWYYNYDYWRYNNYYNNNGYISNRTAEENYYNLLYMNWILIDSTKDNSDDFFKNNVIWNEKEFDMLDAINIKSYSFKSATYNSKYSDAKKFISEIKSITKSRYEEWKISYDQIYDIINDLDYLADNLNNQFSYYKKYETTWNSMYKDLSVESGTQVRTNYNKLKFTLKNL